MEAAGARNPYFHLRVFWLRRRQQLFRRACVTTTATQRSGSKTTKTRTRDRMRRRRAAQG